MKQVWKISRNADKEMPRWWLKQCLGLEVPWERQRWMVRDRDASFAHAALPARRRPTWSSPQARAIFISFHSVAKDVAPSLFRTLIKLSSGPVLFLSNYHITLRIWIPSQETSRESINCEVEYLHLCIYLLITKSMWHFISMYGTQKRTSVHQF